MRTYYVRADYDLSKNWAFDINYQFEDTSIAGFHVLRMDLRWRFLRPERSARRTHSRGLALAALAVASMLAANCAGLGSGGPDVYAFSHAEHVELQGMACVVCHKMDEGTDVPTMPEPGLCLLCHKRATPRSPRTSASPCSSRTASSRPSTPRCSPTRSSSTTRPT